MTAPPRCTDLELLIPYSCPYKKIRIGFVGALRAALRTNPANSNVYEAGDFVGRYTEKIAAVRRKGVTETHRAVVLSKKGSGLDCYVDDRREDSPTSKYNPI